MSGVASNRPTFQLLQPRVNHLPYGFYLNDNVFGLRAGK
jgi:hypothetical protein